VHRGSEISNDTDVWDMAEFFIVRGYRRLRIGTKVAQEIWEKFPGKWEVRVIDRSQRAMKFWGCAISEFLGKEIDSVPLDKEGEGWHVFSFESERAA
jgi:predicted acetyltransferase